MCGIAGIILKQGRRPPERLRQMVGRMAGTMAHRGPDDQGIWIDPRGICALAQNRLSIIDLSSAGHQPMISPDGNHVLSYNGELYNFLDLRAELTASGMQFSGRSDSEVLLGALRQYGSDVLPRLDAMFAFALWNCETRELVLARDMFGEKPLYYAETNEFFAFASELHALTTLPDFDAGIDQAAIAHYLCYQYISAPATIYRSVRKLSPGCALTLDARGNARIDTWFQFATAPHDHSATPLDALADELEDILSRTVARRLISDVPLGAFLSGGVDSTVVAAIVTRKLGRPLDTFSIGFDGHADSEHLQARETAAHLGTRHHDRILSPDVLELGDRIGTMLDEPNGDSSCLPTYLLAGFAREHVTVALSGDGGDEMFGGYGRYFATVADSLRGDANWSAGASYLSDRILVYPEPVLTELLGDIPAPLAHELATERVALDTDRRPLINRLRALDARHYLPGAVLAKVDRMSMQHALEVRAPLLGREVAQFAMSLAGDACHVGGSGQGKEVLKRVAARYVPREWLDRPKRGFGLPMDGWGKSVLLPMTRSLVLAPDSRIAEFIDRTALAGFLERQVRSFSPYRVWSLFILENWFRHHPGTATAAPAAVTLPRLAFLPRLARAGRWVGSGIGQRLGYAR
jgi:asparagine synthase (glutamine-hydrolysing)